MKLRDLLEEIPVAALSAPPESPIAGIAYDSRRVRAGDLFFALPGTRADGGAFVEAALAAGAVAAVVGEDYAGDAGPVIHVSDPRKALARAAARFHRHPSRHLRVVGVTGTNGKTTVTWMMESILRTARIVPGVIGTTGYRLDRESRPAPFTTPQAPELQGLLREMVDRGIGAVAIELSSHALEQRRCHGLACDVAVFTNLTHDHLDYHSTLERYLDAKLMLFDGRNEDRPAKHATAVVNADDRHAAAVRAAAARGAMTCVTYGVTAGADVAISELAAVPGGLRFTLRSGGHAYDIRLPLLGRHNAWNAAAAFAAAGALGIAPEITAAGLAGMPAVPGRLERVADGLPFEVVVDYAHTPDALASALRAARAHTRGRVLLVFGCGGDRDRAKRPEMGRIAAAESDRAWVTNDNPRGEAPEAIAAEVTAGAPDGSLEVELDRRAAIGRAIEAARPGDVVLIAGKGHETTQTIGLRVLPFDDREVAREWLAARGGERG